MPDPQSLKELMEHRRNGGAKVSLERFNELKSAATHLSARSAPPPPPPPTPSFPRGGEVGSSLGVGLGGGGGDQEERKSASDFSERKIDWLNPYAEVPGSSLILGETRTPATWLHGARVSDLPIDDLVSFLAYIRDTYAVSLEDQYAVVQALARFLGQRYDMIDIATVMEGGVRCVYDAVKETEEWLAQGKQIRNLSGWVYRKIKRIARWYRKNGWSTW